MKRYIHLALFLFMYCVPSLQAAENSGIPFNDSYQDHGITMTLQGTGLKTLLFFKAFVAGYYLAPSTPADDLGEFPKRIEVQYFVNIPGSKLNSYTIERMKVNVTPAELEGIKAKLKLMARYFVDLRAGDRFALTYIPGIGTAFEHNGKITGSIEGSLFAKALFAVWIGKKPFDEGLKLAIIGSGKVPEVSKTAVDITPGYVSQVVQFGPKETAMYGSIKYSVVGMYKAHFNDFKGSVAVDDESNSIRSVFLEIEAGSIQSSCLWCDKIVRSTKLLNTNKNPKIVFKSNDILRDDKGYCVKGVLEMNGKSKEMRFPFTFALLKDAVTGKRMLDMQGKWDINRKDFNIVWNMLLDHGGVLVGDNIRVEWGIKVNIQ